jgi:hypothetical protein
MNVLIEASADLRKASFIPEEEADPEEKARKRIRYKKTEKRLADYFNTAAGIAKIRAKIEESSDKKTLSDLVKIDYNGKKISWNDFFYDEDRYPILFKKAAKITYPVAILITVKKRENTLIMKGIISSPSKERYAHWSMRIKAKSFSHLV